MALTTVTGKIADIKTGTFGVGLKIAEHISAGDKNFDRSWMCWMKNSAETFEIGTEVTVTGSLGVKIARDKEGGLRGYVDQTTGATVPYIDLSLNNCQIEKTSW
jgi:hypothetical protein